MAADSARGAVLGICVRSQTESIPALIRVERRIAGAIPDTFTAYALFGYPNGGVPVRAGYRYAMLLRDAQPPAAPEFRRVFQWRAPAEFEVRYSDVVRPGLDAAFDDSAAVALYDVIWKLPAQSRSDQVSTLASWVREGGPAATWAAEAVARHPDVWGDALRDAYLDRLRASGGESRQRAVGPLAMHPDTMTHVEFRRLAAGDSLGWTAALRLAATDPTPWVRQVVLGLGARILDWLSGPAPDFGASPSGGWSLDVLRTADGLVAALSPDRSPTERQMLIRAARLARPRHGLRYAALRALAGDTSKVVQDLITETVRGDSASGLVWMEDAPEPGDVTPYWTTAELHRALQDTFEVVRYYAVDEMARRRDLAGSDTVLAWLRQDRVPGRSEIPLVLACRMIEAVGASRNPAAFADLMTWGEIPEEHVHMAVMAALTSLGDRRGAEFFRRLARVPCTQMDYFAARRLAWGLAELGDRQDAWLFELWARERPGIRDAALEAVGVLGGVPRMVELMRRLEPVPVPPERARDYELIEARVRGRLESRGRASTR